MPRLKRKADLLRHASQRVAERCHVDMSKADLDRLGAEIRSGKGSFVRRQSNIRTVWLVTINGEPMHAIYDKKRKAIVTVLFPPSSPH